MIYDINILIINQNTNYKSVNKILAVKTAAINPDLNNAHIHICSKFLFRLQT